MDEVIIAIQKNDIEKLKQLLEEDSEGAYALADNGVSALMVSIYYQRAAMTLLLLDKINRNQFGYKSLAIVFIIGLITFLLWASNRMGGNFQFYLVVAKVSALIGICLLSLTIFLSLRLHFMESLFGGLDKVYKAHHLIGQIQ